MMGGSVDGAARIAARDGRERVMRERSARVGVAGRAG